MISTLLIASYLEPEHVERIRAVSPRLNVVYRPDLLAPPRYHADHTNLIERSPAAEAEWRSLLAQADILNERLTDLFCDNLHRFLAGQPLRHVLDTERLY